MDPLLAGAALTRIDAGAVGRLGQRLAGFARELRAAAAVVGGVPPNGWSGGGRSASAVAAVALQRRLETCADTLTSVGLALAALEQALQSAVAEVVAARRVLAAEARTDVHGPVLAQLGVAVGAFEDADRRASSVVADAFLQPLIRPPGLVRSTLEAGARDAAAAVAVAAPAPVVPAAISVWWAGLPPAARADLQRVWPAIVGDLSGVPAGVRDAVNRRLLARALLDAGAQVAAAPPYGTAWMQAHARLARLQGLAATVRPAGRQLLVFDPAGDGEAAVATGDVERSTNLAVLVPGMSTELEDVPRLVGRAAGVAASAGAGTVAVAWLGYDAPGVLQVASDRRARAGAGALTRFAAGLRATAVRREHLSVLGHSYGTLVTGLAARRGLDSDDVVLLGSPGVEARQARELGLPPGHVWVARVPTDPIELVFLPARLGRMIGVPLPQVFGPDPAGAAFGARTFNAGGAYGHSGYFSPGSASLANLGRIVSSRPVQP